METQFITKQAEYNLTIFQQIPVPTSVNTIRIFLSYMRNYLIGVSNKFIIVIKIIIIKIIKIKIQRQFLVTRHTIYYIFFNDYVECT